MRSAGGTKSAPPSIVTLPTNSTIAFFAGPSFQEGRGSSARAVVAAPVKATVVQPIRATLPSSVRTLLHALHTNISLPLRSVPPAASTGARLLECQWPKAEASAQGQGARSPTVNACRSEPPACHPPPRTWRRCRSLAPTPPLEAEAHRRFPRRQSIGVG